MKPFYSFIHVVISRRLSALIAFHEQMTVDVFSTGAGTQFPDDMIIKSIHSTTETFTAQ